MTVGGITPRVAQYPSEIRRTPQEQDKVIGDLVKANPKLKAQMVSIKATVANLGLSEAMKLIDMQMGPNSSTGKLLAKNGISSPIVLLDYVHRHGDRLEMTSAEPRGWSTAPARTPAEQDQLISKLAKENPQLGRQLRSIRTKLDGEGVSAAAEFINVQIANTKTAKVLKDAGLDNPIVLLDYASRM